MEMFKNKIAVVAVVSVLVVLGVCIPHAFLSSSCGIHYPDQPEEMPLMDRKGFRNPENWGFLNAHDPAVLSSPVDGWFYVYSTDLQHGMLAERGCQIRRSRDLISWEFAGWALPEGPPPDVDDWAQPVNLWAPCCIKIADEYRLYYAASLFGKQQSAIALAVSDRPEGPFKPRGIVLKTREGDPVNAIDPGIIRDVETGQLWMVYGSFWGGIRMLRLDEDNGLPHPDQDSFGIELARRSPRVDGAVEGADIVFNPDTGYYYLFVSYGSLFSDYNVRVARSRNVTGPYLDYSGKTMTDTNAMPQDVGLKITTGYRFGEGQGWFACGHSSVIENDGSWFMMHHARPEYGRNWAYLHVRTMRWSSDGWPVVSPLLYAGERIQDIDSRALPGNYEAIVFENNPDSIISDSIPLSLSRFGRFTLGSGTEKQNGRWEKTGGETIRLDGGRWTADLYIIPSWDRDQNAPVFAFTGLCSNGISFWARESVTSR